MVFSGVSGWGQSIGGCRHMPAPMSCRQQRQVPRVFASAGTILRNAPVVTPRTSGVGDIPAFAGKNGQERAGQMTIELHTWNTPNGRKISVALEEMGLP